jgi:hypothetical protein
MILEKLFTSPISHLSSPSSLNHQINTLIASPSLITLSLSPIQFCKAPNPSQNINEFQRKFLASISILPQIHRKVPLSLCASINFSHEFAFHLFASGTFFAFRCLLFTPLRLNTCFNIPLTFLSISCVPKTTSFRPLNFKINYEFVDLFQDGLPFDNDQGCNRKFVSNVMEPQTEPIVFRSNRNVFLFGRAGAINLK